MQSFISHFKTYFLEVVADEKRRNRIQFLSTYGVLCLVALFMSAVNIFTHKWLLMGSTLAFAVLCLINIVLCLCGEKTLKISSYLFMPEILILIGFFVVSGTPEGFSAIWAAMIPACGLLLYRAKKGSILSLVLWLELIFFLWTPFGRTLLHYDYTDSFMLRFPFLYLAFYFLALILEVIRAATFENYSHMCSHDALTGALNRRGFMEHINEHIRAGRGETVGFAIFDLDHFKLVNDTYGHFSGDLVLQEAERRLSASTGMEICRWGGEEFALFTADADIDRAWADKIVAEFSKEKFAVHGAEIPVTISAGAVAVPRSAGITADELCKLADACLYEAKKNGRNIAVFRAVSAQDPA